MAKPASKIGNRIGVGCVVLFAAPFAGFSLFAAWQAYSIVALSVDARSWVETTAKIDEVQLEKHSDGEGGSTYEVLANYQYAFEGRNYTGERVGLATEADNLKRYHQRLYDRLKSAQDTEQPVACYVDPDDPERSLLDRRLRWVSLIFYVPFALGFGFVGFGLIAGAVYAYGKMQREEKLQAAEPDQPWLWREDWKRGLINSTGRDRLLAAGYGGFFWNTIAWPIAIILWSGETDTPWWGVALVSLFPAIGLWLVAWWAYLLVQRRRYGESKLRLATLPGVIGGRFVGAILAPRAVADADGVRIALTCRQTTGSGDDQETRVAWKDERTVKKTLDTGERGRVGVPVAFTIPSGCLPTEEHEVEWKLSAKAKLPGIDYDAEFVVPIFRTADSQEGVEAEGTPETEYEQAVPLERLLAEQGIEAQELGTLGGYRYAVPAWRLRVAGFVLPIVTLVFGGVGVGLLMNAFWLFGAVFAFFGVILLLISLDTWLGQSELRITPLGWNAANGWWGMTPAATEFAAEDIASIEAEKSGSTGEVVDYRVVAYLPGDKRVVLVRNVRGPQASRMLVEHLREVAGIETDAPAIAPERSLAERRKERLTRSRS